MNILITGPGVETTKPCSPQDHGDVAYDFMLGVLPVKGSKTLTHGAKPKTHMLLRNDISLTDFHMRFVDALDDVSWSEQQVLDVQGLGCCLTH